MLAHPSRWSWLVVVLAVQCCWSGRADEAVPQRVLQGIVVDEEGQPVAKAKVTAVNRDAEHETTTDEQGHFELRLTPLDSGYLFVSLAAESPDGRLGTLLIQQQLVQQQKEEPVRITVKPARELVISVQDGAGGPVEQADVEFISSYRRLAGGMTDAAGRWKGRVPTDGDWSVLARKAGIGCDYATGSMGRGSKSPPRALPEQLTLTFDGVRPVTIKAIDQNGQPVAGLRAGPWYLKKPGREVELNLSRTSVQWPATAADGTLTVDWLPAKSTLGWNFLSPSPDVYPLDQQTFAQPDSPSEITVRVFPIESLSGRVTHADGRPAEGISIRAEGQGAGGNRCHKIAQTDAEGRYQVRAFSEQAYIVTVEDLNWAAPYRADVIVRAGQPVGGVDFVLTKPTRVHGRVTIGAKEQPAGNMYLQAVISKGQIPAELRRKDDRIYRSVYMQFSEPTDDDGNYEFLLGPGDYELRGPPRTEPMKISVPAEGGGEIVRNFKMPRAETGPITIHVVDHDGKPIAGATLSGTYASSQARRMPDRVNTDSQGIFKTERSLDPLVLHATTADKQLAGIVRSDSEETEAKIIVGPLATASGRLLNLAGEPVPNKQLSYYIRVFHEDQKRQIWNESFGGKTTTDADGRFTFARLVPGQLYEASIPLDEHSSRRVVNVKPTTAEPIDLGDIKADTEPTKPYVPPTPAEKTAEAFGARPKNSVRERLDRVLMFADLMYTRPLLLIGNPTDKACVELFRLFDQAQAAETKNRQKLPTPHDLRWEYELLSLDDARPGVAEFIKELGIQHDKHEPMLALLSGEGKLIATFPLKLKGETIDGLALGRFLAEHKLPTRDAENMLADGLRQAQAEDKRLFFIFSASWCGPCRLLAEFLSQHQAELHRHYEFIKLDVSRDEHAEELRAKYKESKSGGVPWFTILDADGKMLATSNAPADADEPAGNTNIGFPSEKKGIDHFVKMLQETAPRLAPAKLAEIRDALLKAQ